MTQQQPTREPKAKKCSIADIELLEKLLPAIAGRFGSSPFRVSEALADPAIRAMSGSLQPTRLGSLFAKAVRAGDPIQSYVLTHSTLEHGARLWVVSRLP